MTALAHIACLACAAIVAGCAALAPRPLPPKLQVEGVRSVISVNGDTRFRIGLKVTNPNAYDVAVRTIEATLRVEDRPVAVANLADPVVLKAAGDTSVEIEARPDFNALASALDRILRRLAVRYEVAGFAVVDSAGGTAGADGSMRLPFTRRGELPLADLMGRLR